MTHTDLVRLIALRASGRNIKSLADEFQKDRTTIRFHLEKYSIRPFVLVIRKERRPQTKQFGFLFERINQGKTYQEYLRDQKPAHSFVKDFRGSVPVQPFKSTMQEV